MFVELSEFSLYLFICDPLWEKVHFRAIINFALRVVFGSWTDFSSFGQNRFSILCVSMDHQLTPRVGAASFRLSHGLLRLLERELFIIYIQNMERNALKLYGALYVIHQFRVNLRSIRRCLKLT